MSHAVTAPRRSPFIATLVAATLLAAGAFALTAASDANAAAPDCPRGSFCLWEHAGFEGGKYTWSGSDQDLTNDFYRLKGVRTKVKVSNSASSAQNNGNPQNPFQDVLVYNLPIRLGGASGPTTCIPENTAVYNLTNRDDGLSGGMNWNDRIMAYKWVRNTC